jgi:hypothetical protein
LSLAPRAWFRPLHRGHANLADYGGPVTIVALPPLPLRAIPLAMLALFFGNGHHVHQA